MTLEFLGIIIPFLLIPRQLENQHIIVKVDNVACFFGWIKRHSPGDEMASIFIPSLASDRCKIRKFHPHTTPAQNVKLGSPGSGQAVQRKLNYYRMRKIKLKTK
jgi:hypothetical protein